MYSWFAIDWDFVGIDEILMGYCHGTYWKIDGTCMVYTCLYPPVSSSMADKSASNGAKWIRWENQQTK